MRLSRLQRVLGLSLVLLIAFPAGLVSAASAGQSCKKVGALATSKSGGKTIKLVCTKVGKKLVWVVKGTKPAQPGTTTTTTVVVVKRPCVPGGVCVIGDIGPGGGIVFYDAGSLQPWGRYMEAAPANSSANIAWCSNTTQFLGTDGTDAIGSGAANTALMLATCTTGAANNADTYSNNGKSDWFLPSKGELNQMYLNKDKIGFSTDVFWSSSESYATAAWAQGFQVGSQYPRDKFLGLWVRPVRAFSPTTTITVPRTPTTTVPRTPTTTVPPPSGGGNTGVTGISFVDGHGSSIYVKITPLLSGISITCNWSASSGSKATSTTTTAGGNATCTSSAAALWEHAIVTFTATVTGTNLIMTKIYDV